MRAVWITKHGGPETLVVREANSPEPGPGEIAIRVNAAGVGFADIMARQGIYPLAPKPPCIMGYEVAGIVETHGPGVEGPPIGTRVMALCHFNAQAERVVASSQLTMPLPENMTFEQAAAIPMNYVTAHHLIYRVAVVRPGDRVLVHMAGGGVGTAMLQFLRNIPDITIFGTASRSKHDALTKEGCQYPIDYRTLDYVEEVKRITDGQGVDVVLDPLGGRDWNKGIHLLRPLGRLVVFGFANIMTGERKNPIRMIHQFFRVPRFSPLKLQETNRSVAGVSVGRLWDQPKLLNDSLSAALGLCSDGKVHPCIDSVHSFEQTALAHRRIESRSNVGKVLLVP